MILHIDSCFRQQTLLMTILRVIFFRLYESPRYLVAAGRPAEAMENLQLISKFNGEELDLSLRDVRDHFGTIRSRRSASYSTISPRRGRSEEAQPFLSATGSSTIFNADTERDDETTRVSGSKPDSADYNTTGETNTIRNNTYPGPTPTLDTSALPTLDNPFNSPSHVHGHGHQRSHTGQSVVESDEDDEQKIIPRTLRVPRNRRRSSVSVSYKSIGWLPRFIRKPLWAYLDRISLVLTPEWIWTTLTVWAVWFSMALGMFLQQQQTAPTVPDWVCSVYDVQCFPTQIIREAARRNVPQAISCEIYCRNPVRKVIIGGQLMGCSDLFHRRLPWCNCEFQNGDCTT
jgi:hypothetical protein